MEIWKEVIGYPEYEVSNTGLVKSKARTIDGCNQSGRCKMFLNEIIKKQSKTKKGYLATSLRNNGKKKTFAVHRLVAINFIPNPLNLPQVNHKDGVKTNNSVDNLEWITNLENMRHAYKNGLNKINPGEESRNVKLTNEEVIEIFTTYSPGLNGNNSVKLSKKFNVHQATIIAITSGRRWTHITKNLNKTNHNERTTTKSGR